MKLINSVKVVGYETTESIYDIKTRDKYILLPFRL